MRFDKDDYGYPYGNLMYVFASTYFRHKNNNFYKIYIEKPLFGAVSNTKTRIL